MNSKQNLKDLGRAPPLKLQTETLSEGERTDNLYEHFTNVNKKRSQFSMYPSPLFLTPNPAPFFLF